MAKICGWLGHVLPSLIWVFPLAAIGLRTADPSGLVAAKLKPKTLNAFNQYVKLAEARMNRNHIHPDDLLYIETLPKPQCDSIISTLKQGQVYVHRIPARDADGDSFDVPDGMIHHWVGDIFIPGRSVATALEVLRDYNDFKNIYKPEVVRSRLVRREDHDDYKVYVRLQKKSIVTVTLDTWYDIHFTPVGKDSGYSRSVSTRIQQVENAGAPNEYLDPVGRDSGFLWRINSYWRYQQRDNGVIIEWESISLSRDIPFLLAWFVKPLVRNIAREAVTDMLTATRKAVLAYHAGNKQAKSLPQSFKFTAHLSHRNAARQNSP